MRFTPDIIFGFFSDPAFRHQRPSTLHNSANVAISPASDPPLNNPQTRCGWMATAALLRTIHLATQFVNADLADVLADILC